MSTGMITRLEAQEILGCKESKFYSLIREGKLPRGCGYGKVKLWSRALIEKVRDATAPSEAAVRECLANAVTAK